jgi:hypothetical protein
MLTAMSECEVTVKATGSLQISELGARVIAERPAKVRVLSLPEAMFAPVPLRSAM